LTIDSEDAGPWWKRIAWLLAIWAMSLALPDPSRSSFGFG
jgi:hypothetical protein